MIWSYWAWRPSLQCPPLSSIPYEAEFYVLAGILGALATHQRRATHLIAAFLAAVSLLLIFRAQPHYLLAWGLGAATYRFGHYLRRTPIFIIALAAAALSLAFG